MQPINLLTQRMQNVLVKTVNYNLSKPNTFSPLALKKKNTTYSNFKDSQRIPPGSTEHNDLLTNLMHSFTEPL